MIFQIISKFVYVNLSHYHKKFYIKIIVIPNKNNFNSIESFTKTISITAVKLLYLQSKFQYKKFNYNDG